MPCLISRQRPEGLCPQCSFSFPPFNALELRPGAPSAICCLSHSSAISMNKGESLVPTVLTLTLKVSCCSSFAQIQPQNPPNASAPVRTKAGCFSKVASLVAPPGPCLSSECACLRSLHVIALRPSTVPIHWSKQTQNANLRCVFIFSPFPVGISSRLCVRAYPRMLCVLLMLLLFLIGPKCSDRTPLFNDNNNKM